MDLLDRLGFSDALSFLEERFPAVKCLSEEQCQQLADMAERLLKRNLPEAFVLASVRSAFQQMLDLDAEEVESDAGSLDRVRAGQVPRKEAKSAEREALLQHTRRLIREAKAAKQPYERKKMRRELMSIDQAYLRRVLGKDAVELCMQINEFLRSCRDLR
ncbi:MAG: hypothetical protein ACP5R4_02645 [Armatimonadota bacterium]